MLVPSLNRESINSLIISQVGLLHLSIDAVTLMSTGLLVHANASMKSYFQGVFLVQ